MAFFLGDEDGVGANDALARQLGEAGRKWAMEYVSLPFFPVAQRSGPIFPKNGEDGR